MSNNESAAVVGEIVASDQAVISEQYSPLEKHIYPFWIKMAGLISGLLFLFLVPRFLLIDLPIRYEVYQKIVKADAFFLNKDYSSAVLLYEEIFIQYPNFNTIKLVKSCFALSVQYSDFYKIGLHYLVGRKCTDSEVEEMQFFLPEEYKKDFKSQFKKVQ